MGGTGSFLPDAAEFCLLVFYQRISLSTHRFSEMKASLRPALKDLPGNEGEPGAPQHLAKAHGTLCAGGSRVSRSCSL